MRSPLPYLAWCELNFDLNDYMIWENSHPCLLPLISIFYFVQFFFSTITAIDKKSRISDLESELQTLARTMRSLQDSVARSMANNNNNNNNNDQNTNKEDALRREKEAEERRRKDAETLQKLEKISAESAAIAESVNKVKEELRVDYILCIYNSLCLLTCLSSYYDFVSVGSA